LALPIAISSVVRLALLASAPAICGGVVLPTVKYVRLDSAIQQVELGGEDERILMQPFVAAQQVRACIAVVHTVIHTFCG
jgi:hypothetical protein